MSPCPACGQAGRHVAVIVPWDAAEKWRPGARALIQHVCDNTSCPQDTWSEVATDQAGIEKRLARAFHPPSFGQARECKTTETDPRKGLALWSCSRILGFTLWMDYTGQYPNRCPGCGEATLHTDLSPKVAGVSA